MVVQTGPAAGATWPSDVPLRVVFDRYLDPSLGASASVNLQSDEEAIPVALLYDPVGLALEVRPRLELTPGVGYQLTVTPGAVRGADGSALAGPVEVGFVASAAAGWSPAPPVDFATELAPLFAARCSCHGPPIRELPTLEPDALVAAPSPREPELALVEPGQPLRSVLVRKLLPGYPGILGKSMPPDGPLAPADLRRVISWVREL